MTQTLDGLSAEANFQVAGIFNTGTDIYDRGGEPTLLSAGCLIETMAIAASAHRRTMAWTYERRGEHDHAGDSVL